MVCLRWVIIQWSLMEKGGWLPFHCRVFNTSLQDHHGGQIWFAKIRWQQCEAEAEMVACSKTTIALVEDAGCVWTADLVRWGGVGCGSNSQIWFRGVSTRGGKSAVRQPLSHHSSCVAQGLQLLQFLRRLAIKVCLQRPHWTHRCQMLLHRLIHHQSYLEQFCSNILAMQTLIFFESNFEIELRAARGTNDRGQNLESSIWVR